MRLPAFESARGLNRVEAARYVGVSPSMFDRLVAAGQMPEPKCIGARRVYDRQAIDVFFDLLDGQKDVPNAFDGG